MTASPSTRLYDAYAAPRLSVAELWFRWLALGGEASEMEADAYLNEAIAPPAFQHDMLAQAINERLDEIAPPRAPYNEDFMPLDTSTNTCGMPNVTTTMKMVDALDRPSTKRAAVVSRRLPQGLN
jgi:hypothetical protein